MYHAIVRRRVRAVFEQLSHGEWRQVLTGTAEDLHHVFPGDHALGGERHSRGAVKRWFERLERVADACSVMAATGIEEAAAAPIVD